MCFLNARLNVRNQGLVVGVEEKMGVVEDARHRHFFEIDRAHARYFHLNGQQGGGFGLDAEVAEQITVLDGISAHLSTHLIQEQTGTGVHIFLFISYFPLACAAFPGKLTEMFPPQAHMHLPLSKSAGIMHTFSCPPGAQGAVMTGMQGIGVSTPQAAAVAAATWGLDID